MNVLPQFSSGAYHGLTIPINLPANHSIPDLFNQIWPGENQKTLSVTSKRFSFVTNLFCFGLLCWLSYKWNSQKARTYLQGAMICLMLIFPVYCYEHHLALLVLPIVIMIRALREEGLATWCYWLAGLSYCFAAWPLFMLRTVQKKVPQIHWLLQESKFFAIVGVAFVCIWGAYQHHRAASAATKRS